MTPLMEKSCTFRKFYDNISSFTNSWAAEFITGISLISDCNNILLCYIWNLKELYLYDVIWFFFTWSTTVNHRHDVKPSGFQHRCFYYKPCHAFCCGSILCMRQAIEIRLYTVTSFLIGWAYTQSDTCLCRGPISGHLYKGNRAR